MDAPFCINYPFVISLLFLLAISSALTDLDFLCNFSLFAQKLVG